MQGQFQAYRPFNYFAVVAFVLSLVPSFAQAAKLEPNCHAPTDLVRLASPLRRIGQKLASAEPITIVAIGSSSTAGSGASSPAATYPSRLADELRRRFPRRSITVINQGVPGEEIGDMLRRFDAALIAARPDLVLWQLGTNSVIHDHPLNDHGAAIRGGVKKIRAIGADIVLIDPQFAPKVLAKPDAPRMVKLIAATAREEHVDLFPRYDLMRQWHEVYHLGFDVIVAPDGLHMNDWSYACMAHALAETIVEAAQRPVLSATARQQLP